MSGADGRAMADGHVREQAEPERPRVLVFFDYACPFCYVDQHRFDALEEELDFDILLVPFELRPDMSESGKDLSAVGTGHSERVDEYLVRTAEKEGFPFTQPSLLPNTHRALVLGEVARDHGDEMHRDVHAAVFRAYFGEGLDIGDPDVLKGVASDVGIDVDELERAWAERTYDERLHQFRHVAMHLGLDATPAALICNELFIGSRPEGVLREALERCGSQPELAGKGPLDPVDDHEGADPERVDRERRAMD